MSKIIQIEELVYGRLRNVSKADWLEMLNANGAHADYTTFRNDYLLLEYSCYRFEDDKMISSERTVHNLDFSTYDLKNNEELEEDTIEVEFVQYNPRTDRYIVRYAHYPLSEKYTSPELPHIYSEDETLIFIEPPVVQEEPVVVVPAEEHKEEPAVVVVEEPIIEVVEEPAAVAAPTSWDTPLSRYIWYFQHLNRSNRGGEKAPHKIILLLAVLALYANAQQQKKVVISLSQELTDLFNQYWRMYVKSPIWKMDITMPWTHMSSEPFWHDCHDESKGCYIDTELRDLLQNVMNRKELREVLKGQL